VKKISRVKSDLQLTLFFKRIALKFTTRTAEKCNYRSDLHTHTHEIFILAGALTQYVASPQITLTLVWSILLLPQFVVICHFASAGVRPVLF